MNNAVCLICKDKIITKGATPSSCDHVFHFSCLMQWTSEKTANHNCPCPVSSCGKKYDSIKILSTDADSMKLLTTVNNLLCPVCINVLKSPFVIMGCCERNFCLDCLITALKQKLLCPMDRRQLDQITVLSWIRDSVALVKDYHPTVRYLKDIGRALSAEFVCRVCKSPENVDDIYFCITCSNCYHRQCDPNPVFRSHPLIWICKACIEESRGEPR